MEHHIYEHTSIELYVIFVKSVYNVADIGRLTHGNNVSVVCLTIRLSVTGFVSDLQTSKIIEA